MDLFTGKTWEEFLKNGGNISGFRERRRKTAETIMPGDFLIGYLTGLSRFITVLEVKSKCYFDKTPIWSDELFPCRFKVEILHKLEPKTAIPVLELRDKLGLFKNLKSQKTWSGFFRGSPIEFDTKDAEIIVEAVANAVSSPIIRAFDEKKYWRQPKTYQSKVGTVTVPEEKEETQTEQVRTEEKTTHEEIQWLLLKLGSDMGFDVWVARNDRNRQFSGNAFQQIPKLRNELPMQFDDATNKTIELIDVLWLQGNTIVAAFEVEHTTTIYSGLLRMSDLMSMQPNLRINPYIVASDDKRVKVISEINRPTFATLKPPLSRICRFIPYSKLKREIEQLGPKVKYMKAEFLYELAESCETEEL